MMAFKFISYIPIDHLTYHALKNATAPKGGVVLYQVLYTNGQISVFLSYANFWCIRLQRRRHILLINFMDNFNNKEMICNEKSTLQISTKLDVTYFFR